MTFPYIVTPNSLSIMIDDKNYIVERSHANFTSIVAAIKNKAWDSIRNLIDIPKAITTFGQGRVAVKNGVVYYDDTPVHNSLTKRILAMMTEGFDINPFVNFMERLMQNPSNTAVNELYDFLEACNNPITEDGYFLAYKKVNTDLKDFYTGKFDHTIGTVLEMPRNMVNDNRHQTCSDGFHFCSFSYLPHYASNRDHRVMILKIDPKDVVSIPSDYANAKGRACKYVVVDEHQGGIHTEKFDKSVYSYPEALAKVEEVEVVIEPKKVKIDPAWYGGVLNTGRKPVTKAFFKNSTAKARDAKGRFIKKDTVVTVTKGPKRDAKGRFIKKNP